MIGNFWHEDPKERANDLYNFSKNLALAGAALALMAVEEPGRSACPLACPNRSNRAKRAARRIAA